jgi:hypothetical protein
MIKKRLERIKKIILVCCLGTLVYSCTPEDGTNGTNGIDGLTGAAGANGTNGAAGTNGTNGAAGTNGTNGTNGQGFDELTKFGSISTTLTGTRPDGVAFVQANVFKFTPVTEYEENNLVTKSGSDLEFNLSRFISAPDDVYQRAYTNLELTVINAGLETQSFQLYTYFNNFSIISSDLKFFTFNNGWNVSNSPEITNLSISSYSYNDETKNLKFTFTYTVAADYNSTQHDLTVTGSVDVIVLEQIQFPVAP